MSAKCERREWLRECRRYGSLWWEFAAARDNETCLPWYMLSATPPRVKGLPHRDWWWSGSGDDALSSFAADDIVERAPGAQLRGLATLIGRGCASRGWREYQDTKTLGWVVGSPS